MDRDDNIYSTSSFIQLLRAKYDLDILKLSDILEMTVRDIYKMIEGTKELGKDNYTKLKLLYPELPLCDYDSSYINPLWIEGVF